MELLQWLWEPFTMTIMQQALIAVCLAAVGCAAIGVQVVLRRMAFMGDAMAHATLPGVVLSVVWAWNLLVGAMLAALLAALGIAWASRHGRVNEDSAIGILYTAMFAVGIILLERFSRYRDLAHALIGNPMGVTNMDLVFMSIVVGTVLLTLWCYRRQLNVTLIDPTYASSIGVSPYVVRAVILILCAAMVVVAIRLVGVVLTAALIITPAASARLLTHSILWTTVAACSIALIGSIAGMILSYYLYLAMGASMVVVMSSIFIVLRVWSSCRDHWSLGRQKQTAA